MIGILSATAGTENGKAPGIDQVRRFCAGARRVDRRMFDKPDAFIRAGRADCLRVAFHPGDSLGIIDEAGFHDPVNVRHWRYQSPVNSFRAVDRPVEARSEEHTSELQSLMRISYAVFRLKKKK